MIGIGLVGPLETKLFNGGTAVEFKAGFSSAFDAYLFQIKNVAKVPSSGASLVAHFSIDGGTTWDEGANYDIDAIYMGMGGSNHTPYQSATSHGAELSPNVTDEASFGLNALALLTSPGVVDGRNVGSDMKCWYSSFTLASGGSASGITQCWYRVNIGSRINGVRFRGSDGTTTFKGQIVMFGVPNP